MLVLVIENAEQVPKDWVVLEYKPISFFYEFPDQFHLRTVYGYLHYIAKEKREIADMDIFLS